MSIMCLHQRNHSNNSLSDSGERIGALNIVTKDAETAVKIRSQLNGYGTRFDSLHRLNKY
jgi:hypothetical protein